MKLHEVLESGKKFRRKIWSDDPEMVDYFWKKHTDYEMIDSNGLEFEEVHFNDAIADDFELVEEKIELTESQIREAFRKLPLDGPCGEVDYTEDRLIELLGFSEQNHE